MAHNLYFNSIVNLCVYIGTHTHTLVFKNVAVYMIYICLLFSHQKGERQEAWLFHAEGQYVFVVTKIIFKN